MEDREAGHKDVIKLKRLHYTEKNDVPKRGAPAILSMTDYAPPEFYDSIRAAKPDGYIVGVGIGGILTFLNCFENQSHPPRGIVVADVEPQVIASARIFVEELARANSFDELCENYFRSDKKIYETRMHTIIDGDESLRAANEGRGILFTPMQAWQESLDNTRNVPDANNIPLVVRNNFSLLHSLALQGRFTISFSSITDQEFIDEVQRLSEFRTSSNIVYLSNMADFLIFDQQETSIQNLRSFENDTHPAIFVHSVTRDPYCQLKSNTRIDDVVEDIILNHRV